MFQITVTTTVQSYELSLQRQLEGKRNTPRQQRTIIQIVSASSTTDDVLSVGYNVVLPDQIYCEASSSRLNGNTAFTSSISSISEGNGARRRNESFIKNLCASLLVVVFSGMAQKVWNDLPVLIALLPCVYVLVNSFSGVWASQGIFQDQQQFFFDATIDLSYQIASYKDNTSKEKGTVNLHERFFQ